VSNWRHDQRLHDQTTQDPGPGKAITKMMSWMLIQTSLRKARNSTLVEVRVQYIIWSRIRKQDGTTGVCWEKWHGQRMDAQRISYILEMSHQNATSKSQASNEQDSLSLLSTNLVRQW
jgi:hypothetical protein